MRVANILLGIAACFALLLALDVYAEPNSSVTKSDSLKGDSRSFERAKGRREWVFPLDHGQHPRYRLEWWYYTGIVRTAEGRVFGFQVTFFRQGLKPEKPQRSSKWRVQSLYLAHLAISDLKEGEFHYTSRTGRDSLGVSGAAYDRPAVWLGDWRIVPVGGGGHMIHMEARDKIVGISLNLSWDGEPVLHGKGGLDQKGTAPGQASWYYSLPRMHTTGTLYVGNEGFPISGTTWMDHEFGTSQLGTNQTGWDWFSVRLDTGFDIMVYRLRNRDGTVAAASGGTLVMPSGKRVRLSLGGSVDSHPTPSEMKIRLLSNSVWTSPKTGAHYPLSWTLQIPAINLNLQIEPASQAQELLPGAGLSFGYWEGVIWAQGRLNEKKMGGEGYLELTGYSGDLSSSFH